MPQLLWLMKPMSVVGGLWVAKAGVVAMERWLAVCLPDRCIGKPFYLHCY